MAPTAKPFLKRVILTFPEIPDAFQVIFRVEPITQPSLPLGDVTVSDETEAMDEQEGEDFYFGPPERALKKKSYEIAGEEVSENVWNEFMKISNLNDEIQKKYEEREKEWKSRQNPSQ